MPKPIKEKKGEKSWRKYIFPKSLNGQKIRPLVQWVVEKLVLW